MKEAIQNLINKLEKQHDFEDRFYLILTGQLYGGDISDWANTHFESNVKLGFRSGETAMAEEMIGALTKILEDFEE